MMDFLQEIGAGTGVLVLTVLIAAFRCIDFVRRHKRRIEEIKELSQEEET